ncbi:hypothetical protein N431DRAFT_435425 [Stipitochalara longipes BDJ]|nr:hypothetical protein N431DRAFT_435425 [Stipitochalara longipes BDJ]
MSTDILNELFVSATKFNDSRDPCLNAIIRPALAELALSIPLWDDVGCTLAEIGDFLVRATSILSKLAEHVVYGEHIRIYTEMKIQESENDNDFSELNFLDYLEDKHKALKSIASRLQGAASHVDEAWRESPSPPQVPLSQRHRGKGKEIFVPHQSTSTASELIYQMDGNAWPTRDFEEDVTSANGAAGSSNADGPTDDRSPGSEGSAQSNTNDPLASLSSRGKGHHICPQGGSCTKGGVGRDGELVVFERNSAFKSVLAKFLFIHAIKHSSFLMNHGSACWCYS